MVKLVALTLAVCAVSLVGSFPANNFGQRYRSSKHEEPRDSWPDVISYRGRGENSESRRAKVESAEESAEDSRETAPVAPATLPVADASDEALNELVPGGQVAAQPIQTVEIVEPVLVLAVEQQDQPAEPSQDAPLPAAEVETLTQTDEKAAVKLPELPEPISAQKTEQVVPSVAADEPSVLPEQPASEQVELVFSPEVVAPIPADQSSDQESLSDSQGAPAEAPETAVPEVVQQGVEESLDVTVFRIAEPVEIPLQQQDQPEESSAPQATVDDSPSTETVAAVFDEEEPVAVDEPSQGQTEDVTEQVQAALANDETAEDAGADQSTDQPDLARNAGVTEVNDQEDTTETAEVSNDVVARNALSVPSEESQTEVVSDSTEAAPEALQRQEMLIYHKGPVDAESTTALPEEDEQTQFEGSAADNIAARNSAAEQADDSTAQPAVESDVETVTDSILQDGNTDSPAENSAARSDLPQAFDGVPAEDATEVADAESVTDAN